MFPMSNPIDETKLTAYALGEIADESERRAIEARLASDPTARGEVEQIREVAGLLKDQLAAEPMQEPSAAPMKLPAPRPKRKWIDYALAACIVFGICGVIVAILMPALSKSRYSSRSAAQRVEERNMQLSQAPQSTSAAPVRKQPQSQPYEDMLRYPAKLPETGGQHNGQVVAGADGLTLKPAPGGVGAGDRTYNE